MTPLLAQRARADRAFERIYKRHLGDVYRYTLAVLRNPADAEDVTQTTFLNAYRAFERGERPRNPQNWLIAIAHNVCRQRFRQSARRPEEVEYDDRVGEIVPDDDEQRWSAEDIQRALSHLAFNQRAALVMRELEGRSYPEIAEILNLSVSAVETLIFRARRSLREQLEGSLTCGEAERAISRQLDGRLPRPEKGALRAHLRECHECARFARSQRAQRTAIKALALIPVPSSLTGLFGGGATAGSAVALKAAAVVAVGTVTVGAGYEGAKRAELIVPGAGEPIAATHLESAPPDVVAVVRQRPIRLLAEEATRPAPAVTRGKSAARPAKPAKRPTPVARGNRHGAAPPAHAVARGHEKAKPSKSHVQPPPRASVRLPKAPPRVGRVERPQPKARPARPARQPKAPAAKPPAAERGGGKKDALVPAMPLPEPAAEVTRTVAQVFGGAGV